jgi:NADPH:quinone reductase-like Zn-dependent oxidoreductase
MATLSTEQQKTMRAWYARRRGNPDQVLDLSNDYPMPSDPTGSDLFVRISYAALNPADIILTQILPTWIPSLRNRIPGFDFAGTVEWAGPSAPKEFAPGTEVCSCLGVKQVLTGKGALAEFVLVPSDMVALKPKSLPPAAAAGLGITGQTVALMLKDAKLKPGDKVLVNGGSGGVGTLLVQVAKGMGAHVTATCSEFNIAMVKRLGADVVSDHTCNSRVRVGLLIFQVIDYRSNAPLHEYLTNQKLDRQFDYILDTIRNQGLYDSSPHYLKPDGLYINIGGHGTQWQQLMGRIKGRLLPTWLGGTPRRYISAGLLPTGEFQRQVVKWVDDGLIKEVPIDSYLAMEDALQVGLCASKLSSSLTSVSRGLQKSRVNMRRVKSSFVLQVDNFLSRCSRAVLLLYTWTRSVLLRSIFLIRNRLCPTRLSQTYSQVGHIAALIASVPVCRPWWRPNRISRFNPLRRPSLFAYPPAAGQYAEHLAPLMSVPVGSRTCTTMRM